MEGIFAPGQKLSIRRVAAALGTSPMPARTALRRLATEQALDVLSSGTAIVPRLTRRAFRELSAIRATLEPMAVAMAAGRIDEGQFAALERMILGGEAARAGNDPEGMLRADRDFLFALYRAAAAPMLYGIIESLWLRRGPMFWDARWIILGRNPTGNQHREVLQALRARDGVTAAAELKAEIEAAADYLLSRMRFADDPDDPEGIVRLRPLSLRKLSGKPTGG
ncbi:GntR family transcriptional regulator [Roseomonas terrae]|uniref:GntR family transcriptional regulator n=2 Tax=Neoroseomonas terrae TaxID=424799 RepID=A0ABS5EJU3_9PROT|nr:GntR family transcriptional regulator [Neoroseomonas terrae]